MPPDDSFLRRVVTVLSAFRPEDDDLSPAELARRSGLPKSTAHLDTGLLAAGGHGEVLGALSVSGWTNRVRLAVVAPAVHTTALTLSRMLGERAHRTPHG
jgi:DNA-binding IclR family transcriptional regulator